MREGQDGFCKVRGVRGGKLVTMNYGKSVHPTQETIETEAVNHFAPGAAILSFGNIGCMMSCSYCHNWKTSQARYVEDKDIVNVTPEQAVQLALRRNISILSYTYNDPVVWHEWVLDTARLAHQAGLKNLYKSAFYITPEAINELIPHIDIFSISLKSMDPFYYKKFTAGRLEPVLEGIQQVYKSRRHLELSTLMITDVSDDPDTAENVAAWVLKQLDTTIPLHFVRFHPDFRMRNTIRTPVANLERARAVATKMGLDHVYLGNVYDTPFSNSYCRECGAELVLRYGLNASVVGLDENGQCSRCGADAHFKCLELSRRTKEPMTENLEISGDCHTFAWRGDVRSLHVQMVNPQNHHAVAWQRTTFADGSVGQWEDISLQPRESWRFIIAKSSENDVGAEIIVPPGIDTNLHEVFDRAHFPTVTTAAAPSNGDISPFPIFNGKNRLDVK